VAVKIFGLRILTERGFNRAGEAMATEYAKMLRRDREESNEQLEFWKAKYYYAKARAIVAEQFPRKTLITVKPVAMGVDSGVRIEVGQRVDPDGDREAGAL
jgi:hypothetical protein